MVYYLNAVYIKFRATRPQMHCTWHKWRDVQSPRHSSLLSPHSSILTRHPALVSRSSQFATRHGSRWSTWDRPRLVAIWNAAIVIRSFSRVKCVCVCETDRQGTLPRKCIVQMKLIHRLSSTITTTFMSRPQNHKKKRTIS